MPLYLLNDNIALTEVKDTFLDRSPSSPFLFYYMQLSGRFDNINIVQQSSSYKQTKNKCGKISMKIFFVKLTN
jgi:hypothetical protein